VLYSQPGHPREDAFANLLVSGIHLRLLGQA